MNIKLHKRAIVIHNEYQHKGGEDVASKLTEKALVSLGFEVKLIVVKNSEIQGYLDKINTVLSIRSGGNIAKAILEEIKAWQPEYVALHNFHPQISPGIFKLIKATGAKTIWTVHNFRFSCVNGMYLRDQKICEECAKSNLAIKGIINKCYKNSYIASASVAFSIAKSYWARSVLPYIDVILANSDFTYEKLKESGFPVEKIKLFNNFSEDPEAESIVEQTCNDDFEPTPYFLFAGRLSAEKGVDTIVRAASYTQFQIRIAGSGPEEEYLKKIAGENVTFLGRLSQRDLNLQIQRACAVLVPSRFYETFGRSITEAAALGVRTLGVNHGAVPLLLNKYQLGRVIDSSDPKVWGQAMDEIGNSFEQFDGAKNLQETYQREFSFKAGCSRWKALIDDLDSRV